MPKVHRWSLYFPPYSCFIFFEDLQYHSVSSLSLTISLWIVWCRPSMLDVVCLGQVFHVFVYEWGPIITDQSPGVSNLVMMCSRIKFATTALVAFFKGTTSTHFVKYSVATRICIWPLEGGFIGPIRSSPQVWKGHGVVISCSIFG